MPILYVHGVNVRSRVGFSTFKPLARRYLAPVISDDPSSVTIEDVYWGELAFDPAFGGISRPRSRLLGMGAEDAMSREARIASYGMIASGFEAALAAKLPKEAAATENQLSSGGLGSSGSLGTDGALEEERSALQALNDAALADVLVALVRPPPIDETALQELEAEGKQTEIENTLAALESARAQEAALVIAADTLVQTGEARDILEAAGDAEEQLTRLLSRIEALAEQQGALAGQGFGDWFQRTKDRVSEGARRYGDLKGYLISVVLLEARAPVHSIVSRFLGDVFVYLNERGPKNSPGEIPALLLKQLKKLHEMKVQQDEPLVVVSHSMGGQLMYDAVSYYLPNTPELSHIKVDLWCATASQVGFFEEGKLFHASDKRYKPGNPVPFPSNNLGAWWNVWDHNDVISFTAKDIFQGVDDESYSSGTSFLAAHSAYLATPSFHRKLADKARATFAGGV